MSAYYFCDGSAKDNAMGIGVVEVKRDGNSYYASPCKETGDATDAERLAILKCMSLAQISGQKKIFIYTDRRDASNSLQYKIISGEINFAKTDKHSTWQEIKKKMVRMQKDGFSIVIERYTESNEVHKQWMAKAHTLSREYLSISIKGSYRILAKTKTKTPRKKENLRVITEKNIYQVRIGNKKNERVFTCNKENIKYIGKPSRAFARFVKQKLEKEPHAKFVLENSYYAVWGSQRGEFKPGITYLKEMIAQNKIISDQEKKPIL